MLSRFPHNTPMNIEPSYARSSPLARRWASTACALAVLAGVLTSGCGGREGAWRQYRETTVRAEPAARRGAADAAGAAAAGAEGAGGELRWTAPSGWKEEGGSGMRLASFTAVDGAQTGLCTIIKLGGAAGGLDANVRRWIGQLGIQAPDAKEMAEFLKRQQEFKSEGGWEGVIVDLTELAAPAAESGSMLASSLTVGESTVFVKLTGSVALLRKEKESFTQLCRSLRREE
jgi:hypothetical protein